MYISFLYYYFAVFVFVRPSSRKICLQNNKLYYKYGILYVVHVYNIYQGEKQTAGKKNTQIELCESGLNTKKNS